MANAVEVKNVTMEFNMSKEKVDSIKEYFIKLVKRELHFEQFLALKDVSVTIEQGDVFGIVGLNGSGKSTLLKVISGILKPTKGTVKTVGTISPMIELGAGFDMDLTARENIFLNGSVLAISQASPLLLSDGRSGNDKNMGNPASAWSAINTSGRAAMASS